MTQDKTSTVISEFDQLDREEVEMIIKAYRANISEFIPAAVAHEIEDFINAGWYPAAVIQAIEETAFAPRPSGAYLRAILRSWRKAGRSELRVSDEGVYMKPTNDMPWYRR